jgi:predicted enzyme related to lactoylglutathione lyase
MKSKLRLGFALPSAGMAVFVLIAARSVQDPKPGSAVSAKTQSVQVQYLEIVTPDVDATCSALEKLHGVEFSKPVAGLGNARTAALAGGGRIGVRAPMREDEQPVVRPYILVDDIDAAVEAAKAAGGEIAHPPFRIPDQGKFAIYFQAGIEYGLWQL